MSHVKGLLERREELEVCIDILSDMMHLLFSEEMVNALGLSNHHSICHIFFKSTLSPQTNSAHRGFVLQKCGPDDLTSVALWVLRTVIQTIIPMNRQSSLIVRSHTCCTNTKSGKSVAQRHQTVLRTVTSSVGSRQVVLFPGQLRGCDDVDPASDVGHPLHSVHLALPHHHRPHGLPHGNTHDVQGPRHQQRLPA